VGGEINPQLRHHLHRAGVDPGRLASGALHARPPSQQLPREPLGHLAARGVGHAEEEQARGAHAAFGVGPQVKRPRAYCATCTSPTSTGTSTSGPMAAAKAAPWWMPKLSTATAMAGSKLFYAAVKQSVAVCP